MNHTQPADIDRARWRTLSPLLDQLLDAGPVDRVARLDLLEREDPGLAVELGDLLDERNAVEREAFLECSVLPGDLRHQGERVGSYELERPLGDGGTSTVWLARRSDGRYEGRAAIKFLNVSSMGRRGIQRFRREGSMLAALSHANIARLLDAGETRSGQPYLVLEHVDGIRIDAWCDANALDTEERVRLFAEVLAAVSHAHERRILHRDLKPSNLLVTREGQVKLIDFGIARLQEGFKPGAVGECCEDSDAFTVDFAAPEQVQAGILSPATDVYALGVLLHVLLARSHPTARVGATLDERLLALRQAEPVRLSVAAGLTRHGSLERIVAKALRKDPAQRFPTAAHMAVDLRRHIAPAPSF